MVIITAGISDVLPLLWDPIHCVQVLESLFGLCGSNARMSACLLGEIPRAECWRLEPHAAPFLRKAVAISNIE